MTNKRIVIVLPGAQSIAFTRKFEAPAGRVFQAHTDANLVSQWIGPRGTTFAIERSTPAPAARAAM